MADPTKASSVPAKTATGAAPPFTISPIRQQHRYIKCVFYGSFGSGKTTLAGSAVDVESMRDVLFVSAESGTMSVEESDRIKNVDNIDVVRITDFKMVAHVQEFLKAHTTARDSYKKTKSPESLDRLKKLQARLFGPGMPYECIDDEATEDTFNADGTWETARLRLYETVIIDSLTEIDQFSMYGLLNIQVDMKLDIDNMEVAQFAEFRKNNQMMQILVRAYRDLDMHVLIVCAAQFLQDELKRMHWTPSLTGKLSGQVQGFVDLVGYLQVGKLAEGSKEAPRRLMVQPVGQFDAKSRIASYKESYFDDPTMTKIMAAFRGKAAK